MIFIFLSLTILSYVHAQSVLITCNAGCGCVAETGVAVACSFVKNYETFVIRATKTPSGNFSPVRIVVQSDANLQITCPTQAGAPTNEGYPMCVPIDSSNIPMTPVRISDDVIEDPELEFVEHFVSPIGNISFVVTRQGCSAVSVNTRNPPFARFARIRQSCGMSDYYRSPPFGDYGGGSPPTNNHVPPVNTTGNSSDCRCP